MIIGNIKDIKKYKGINKRLDDTIDFISDLDFDSLKPGMNIINEFVTINRLTYVGKEESLCIPELHRVHYDMQLLLKNKELVKFDDFNAIDDSKIHSEYNEEKDVIKYDVDLRNSFVLDENTFVIFTPNDVHQPSIKLNDDEVIKFVIKVLI